MCRIQVLKRGRWDFFSALSKLGAPLFIFQMEQNFSKLSYKREKIFPTQNYWSNRPILMLTFFCFDILKLTDTFITDNWGEREDTQKVLVAICTLNYFSWLYTFIFVQMFFYTLSSLEPLLFIPWKRILFFKVTLQARGNILRLKKVLHSPYSGATTNYLVDGLFNQFKARLVATWIWYY